MVFRVKDTFQWLSQRHLKGQEESRSEISSEHQLVGAIVSAVTQASEMHRPEQLRQLTCTAKCQHGAFYLVFYLTADVLEWRANSGHTKTSTLLRNAAHFLGLYLLSRLTDPSEYRCLYTIKQDDHTMFKSSCSSFCRVAGGLRARCPPAN